MSAIPVANITLEKVIEFTEENISKLDIQEELRMANKSCNEFIKIITDCIRIEFRDQSKFETRKTKYFGRTQFTQAKNFKKFAKDIIIEALMIIEYIVNQQISQQTK